MPLSRTKDEEELATATRRKKSFKELFILFYLFGKPGRNEWHLKCVAVRM
jgi:hypothetical protein